jgi:uncharacterized protein YggE
VAGTAAIAAVLATNTLGAAVAEAPTGTPVRTVSVEGVASVPIGQFDNAAAATAVYRSAMAAAVADGQSKASFLASKVGAALGATQNVTEGGGYVSCTGGGASGYAEYEGEQPDFGSGPEAAAHPLSGAARPAPTKRPARKRARAKRATAGSCTLTAQVSLVYQLA